MQPPCKEQESEGGAGDACENRDSRSGSPLLNDLGTHIITIIIIIAITILLIIIICICRVHSQRRHKKGEHLRLRHASARFSIHCFHRGYHRFKELAPTIL